MKTLEECKEEYAVKEGYNSWLDLAKNFQPTLIDRAHNEAAELYAQSIREHYEAKLKEKDAEIERLKSGTLKQKTFDIANELAVAGYGDFAVRVHNISNNLK